MGDGRVNDYYVQCGRVYSTYSICYFREPTGTDSIWNCSSREQPVQRGALSPLRNQQSYMWNYGQCVPECAMRQPLMWALFQLRFTEAMDLDIVRSDIWSFDASYLKLKNISLRYDLKRSVLKNLPVIQGLDLSFVVTNAFIWLKKSYPLKDLVIPNSLHTGVYS